MLKKPEHADVVFIVDGKVRIMAHRILLVSSSEFWAKVFSFPQEVGACVCNLYMDAFILHVILFKDNQLQKLEDSLTFDRICNGEVKGLLHIQLERSNDKKGLITAITLDPNYINAKSFGFVLHFLYTGTYEIHLYMHTVLSKIMLK